MKMKLVFGLVLISFGLIGCEQAPPQMSADVRATEEAFADEISLRSKLVTPGMTRDEVVNILGAVYRSGVGPCSFGFGMTWSTMWPGRFEKSVTRASCEQDVDRTKKLNRYQIFYFFWPILGSVPALIRLMLSL